MSERLEKRVKAIQKMEHIRVDEINERVAVTSTVLFGSMWTFYLFFLYGFLPLHPKLREYRDNFLYWGSWVQLWALPLLMVGGIVLNRATEHRAAEDHETLMVELAEIKEIKADILALQEILQRIEARLPQEQSGS